MQDVGEVDKIQHEVWQSLQFSLSCSWLISGWESGEFSLSYPVQVNVVEGGLSAQGRGEAHRTDVLLWDLIIRELEGSGAMSRNYLPEWDCLFRDTGRVARWDRTRTAPSSRHPRCGSRYSAPPPPQTSSRSRPEIKMSISYLWHL